MKRSLAILILFLIVNQLVIAQSSKDSLYVFVGKRISVEKFIPDDTTDAKKDVKYIRFDEEFDAKYVVIQNVYNHYDKDTIEFKAFDHYGTPAFSKYKYVLLFVSNIGGKLYHQKYQFFDVYETADGRWASPGDPYPYYDPQRGNVKAVPIKFKKPVKFNLVHVSAENIKRFYPAPYFEIKGDQAIALMGTYVDDLFKVKKGVLKARGIF